MCELNEPLPQTPSELGQGFLPQHDWRVPHDGVHHPGGLVKAPTDVTPKDEEPEPYCGPRNEVPQSSFNPWRDIRQGCWVLIRLTDLQVCPVWQGQVASDVCREEEIENHGKFFIQFWKPRNAEKTLRKKYRNCWVKEKKMPRWISVDCALFATWSKIADIKTRTIPRASKEAALENLNKANEVDP
jgi:hypothetical protein